MEVILLQKVANLGNIGDRVKVKLGFRSQLSAAAGQGHARHGRQRCTLRGAARRARAPGARAGDLRGRARRGAQGLQAHHPRQGRHGRQAVRLDRHQRHRRGCHSGRLQGGAQRSAPADRGAAHGRRAHRRSAPARRRRTCRCRWRSWRKSSRSRSHVAGSAKIAPGFGLGRAPGRARPAALGGGRAGRARRPAAGRGGLGQRRRRGDTRRLLSPRSQADLRGHCYACWRGQALRRGHRLAAPGAPAAGSRPQGAWRT